MLDKESRRRNMGVNLKRQLKGLIKSENNMANTVGYFACGALLLVGGALTGFPALGLIGGGCLILGLVSIIERNAKKAGGEVSDLKFKSDQLREKAANEMKKK